MSSTDSDYAYFVRTFDSDFWEDRERVKKLKTLIEMYQSHGCRWYMYIANYKNIAIKKNAKAEIGTHFGLSGDLSVIALHI